MSSFKDGMTDTAAEPMVDGEYKNVAVSVRSPVHKKKEHTVKLKVKVPNDFYYLSTASTLVTFADGLKIATS